MEKKKEEEVPRLENENLILKAQLKEIQYTVNFLVQENKRLNERINFLEQENSQFSKAAIERDQLIRAVQNSTVSDQLKVLAGGFNITIKPKDDCKKPVKKDHYRSIYNGSDQAAVGSYYHKL